MQDHDAFPVMVSYQLMPSWFTITGHSTQVIVVQVSCHIINSNNNKNNNNGGGELVQVPPPEIVSGTSKRQRCIGPRNNHPSLHMQLHVSTCRRASLITVH